MKTLKDSESGPEMAQKVAQSNPQAESRHAKTHQDFWKRRLVHRSYKNADGQMIEIPEWHVRIADLGRRCWFNLDTANQSAAAIKARDIYLSLVSAGWEATLAKFKPSPIAKADVCTLGEFLAEVGVYGHYTARTLRIYSTKLRKLVADTAKVETGKRRKAKKAKYDYVNGGRKAWIAQVEGCRMDVLTPDSIAAWRNAYVSHVGDDPVKRRAAEVSAASILRAGRALFAPDVTKLLRVKLPVNPFAGVKLRDPGPRRYHSDINPEWLLACAERDLRIKYPQQYLGLFLCLWAGLRRKEADCLLWEQIDFSEGTLHVRRTPYFEPKTEESERTIDLAPAALDVLRQFKKGNKSEFVMDGADANPTASYGYYRADCTWRDLIAWLKSKGISQRNAIHSLRKESGSLIASSHGIEAARQHLGHRDIRTTSSHYVDKKKRVEINIPMGTAGELRAMEGTT